MTIKELENVLDVPRATIRFYEKENLINPKRRENGYRTYSDNDVEQLRKIIILRKIGLSVNDIKDLFEGKRTLPEVLEQNVDSLHRQISELNGAVRMSHQMLKMSVDIDSLDTQKYWNTITEEEKKGNRFMDIARDIAKEEKKTIFSYFGWTDENGKLYDVKQNIITFIIGVCIIGALICGMDKEKLSLTNIFRYGLESVIIMMVMEVIIKIPIYFIRKKHNK